MEEEQINDKSISSSVRSSEQDDFEYVQQNYKSQEQLENQNIKNQMRRQSSLTNWIYKQNHSEQISNKWLQKRKSIFRAAIRKDNLDLHNPITNHQEFLDALVLQKKKQRNEVNSLNILSNNLAKNKDEKELDTKHIKHQIITRTLPQINKNISIDNNDNQKIEQISQSTPKQQQNETEIQKKIRQNKIYERYFTKIIFNKKDNKGIENKLKIFENLNSYVKSKQYLQNINKIYNMGHHVEQKTNLQLQMNQLKELRENSQNFYKHYLMKIEEEDWDNEKELDMENTKLTNFLRTGIKVSMLDKIKVEEKRKKMMSMNGELKNIGESKINGECNMTGSNSNLGQVSNRTLKSISTNKKKQNVQQLVDYKIHTRQDAQRVYNFILNKEREDIQKLTNNMQQYFSSKDKYERKVWQQKIFTHFDKIKNDPKYNSLKQFIPIKIKIQSMQDAVAQKAAQKSKKVKNVVTALHTLRQFDSVGSLQSPDNKHKFNHEDKYKTCTTNFLEPIKQFNQINDNNKNNNNNNINDIFISATNNLNSDIKKDLIKEKTANSELITQKINRYNLQSQIYNQISQILNIDNDADKINDIENFNSEEIILQNQEKILEKNKTKLLLKDEEIMRIINQLLDNSKQIFQVGFNKFLVQENKRQKEKEKKKLQWDKIYTKLSQKVINNTLQASRHIYNEIVQEKEEEINIHNAIFRNLDTDKLKKDDQVLLRNFIIKKLQDQNVEQIKDEADKQKFIQHVLDQGLI